MSSKEIGRPVLNNVYTVHNIVTATRNEVVGESRSGVFLGLCELPPHGYDAADFRPVRATSIESLRGLLSPTPDDARRFADELECL